MKDPLSEEKSLVRGLTQVSQVKTIRDLGSITKDMDMVKRFGPMDLV